MERRKTNRGKDKRERGGRGLLWRQSTELYRPAAYLLHPWCVSVCVCVCVCVCICAPSHLLLQLLMHGLCNLPKLTGGKDTFTKVSAVLSVVVELSNHNILMYVLQAVTLL